MAIHFFEETKSGLKGKKALKGFIPTIFEKENKIFQKLNIIFCTDKDLLNVNQSFLQHDYYTDIITFDLTENNSDAISGELYISIDRVRENTILQSTDYISELHRVIFHGILHLCGYKDKTKSQIKEIRSKENHYLKQYFPNVSQ
jgi:probable rRNA maturation factor